MVETWRVVLASSDVREVECLYIGTVALAKVYGLRAEGVAVSGQGDNFVEAILDLARDGRLRVVEILAPGEPTRAEAVAAERERCARLCDEVAAWRLELLRAGWSDGISQSAWSAGSAATEAAEQCAAKIRAGGV